MKKWFKTCALVAAACAVASVGSMYALAEVAPVVTPVVVEAPNWWQTLWTQVQAPLVSLLMAIFAAVGVVITTTVRRYVGEGAAKVVGNMYQEVADQAAGWLIAHLNAVAEDVMGHVSTPGGAAAVVDKKVSSGAAQTALGAAIDYARKSYPEAIAKVGGVSNKELGSDIVAAAGKLIAGAKGPAGIASAIGGLIGSLKN